MGISTAVCSTDPIVQAKVKSLLISLDKWPENDDVKLVEKAAKKARRASSDSGSMLMCDTQRAQGMLRRSLQMKIKE